MNPSCARQHIPGGEGIRAEAQRLEITKSISSCKTRGQVIFFLLVAPCHRGNVAKFGSQEFGRRKHLITWVRHRFSRLFGKPPPIPARTTPPFTAMRKRDDFCFCFSLFLAFARAEVTPALWLNVHVSFPRKTPSERRKNRSIRRRVLLSVLISSPLLALHATRKKLSNFKSDGLCEIRMAISSKRARDSFRVWAGSSSQSISRDVVILVAAFRAGDPRGLR